MRWTDDQQKVIDSRNGNLLVSAAAGSGKTAVLVKRIIDMISDTENKMNIDELLVVTFTSAAAAEMKERITDAISKKLDEEPDNKHIYQQLSLMNHASITTLHSFCLDVIRKHFHLLDIDPNFRLADETEVLLIKNDVLAEVLEVYYEEADPEFFELVEAYGGIKRDNPLEELILNLYNFTRSYPWPDRWLDRHAEAFHLESLAELYESNWMKVLMGYIQMVLEGVRQELVSILELLNLPGAPVKILPKVENDLVSVDELIGASQKSYTHLSDQMREFKLESVRIAGKDLDPVIKTKISDKRKKGVKEPLDKLKEDLFFKSPEHMLEDIQLIYPRLIMLVKVVKSFGEAYTEKKREKGLLDFNDLEHIALSLLMEEESTEEQILPTEAARGLRRKYREILVDEYQDSNLVQEILLRAISKEDEGQPNIFMVGDVKQSIYRFRMAKPELFVDKYDTYEPEGLYRRIDLSKNFRSRKEILDGTNYVFENIMNKSIGEIIYDDAASLHVGATYKESEIGQVGGPIEVHLLDVKLSEEDEEHPAYKALAEMTTIEAEAKLVANQIEKLLDKREQRMVYDKGLDDYRPIEYKDIVILLRATSNWAPTFVDELSARGIPAYAETNTGYFDAIEVKTILHLLRVIDNPRQDIPLITVLRSSIVGLKADELVEIRTSLKEGNFYDALVCYVEGELEPTPFGRKLRNFLERLSKWRAESHYTGLNEFIWKLYMDTDYYFYATAMPGGSQRRANLDALIEKAIKFEKSSFSGLFNFLSYMERIKERNGDFGAAKTLGPNENIIRIMSIHKSKGLEFPVVVATGMGKGFNTMDQKKQMLLHQDLGFGPRFVDSIKRVTNRTLPQLAIRQKIKLENLSEELRILYVAFTRARETLILTGSVKSLDKKLNQWSMKASSDGVLPAFEGLSCNSYYDFILPALLKHNDSSQLYEQLDILPPNNVHPSKWKTYTWKIQDILTEEELEEVSPDENDNHSATIEDIQSKLEWKYAKSDLNQLPIKVTVTDLKRQSQESEYEITSQDEVATSQVELTIPTEDYDYEKPSFMEEKQGFSASEKGTIFHQAMMHLDFRNMDNYEAIQRQIQEMVGKGILTGEEAKTIYIKNILDFSRSHIFKKIKKCKKIFKEIPFVIGEQVSKLFPYSNITENELILIQGVIDMYFEDYDGEIILLDYKTDRITEKMNEEAILEKYKKQLELYEQALKTLTHKRIKEKYLYLSSIGKTVKL